MRALSESEIAIIGGGGNWQDVAYNILYAASFVSPLVQQLKVATNAIKGELY
jgi:hypothetical protein